MAGYVLELRGCTPEPLGNYLKGLGVFRLIAEQADPQARAWWKDGVFWLLTKCSLDEMADFFISGIGAEQRPIYKPTPIFSPWGGSPGFYADGDKKPKEQLARMRARAKDGRFSTAQQTIATTDSVLAENHWTDVGKKKRASKKPEIISALRNAWSAAAVEWYDACLSLEDVARFGFLYGTGGNEGRADITNNFWELVEDVTGPKSRDNSARDWLIASLCSNPRVGGTSKTAGQNFPLAAGSSNCGQKFEGSSSANPWDFILMMEGAVLFAAATTKRLSQQGKGKAAFPFMIDHLATDETSTSIKDEAKQDGKVVRCRAEFWLPLWSSPLTLPGLRALFSEGRLQRRSGEQTEHTLHAMEAIQTLGVSSGIDAFHRVALFERRGKGYYLASSLGLHPTSRSSDSDADRLDEIEFFRQQVYRNLREGPGVPDRVMRARHRFHTCLAALLERNEFGASRRTEATLEVLLAVSAIEREVVSLRDRLSRVAPCPTLAESWLDSCPNDPEHRIARAAAGIASWGGSSTGDERRPAVESLRSNLLPVSRQRRIWGWDATTRSAVWTRGASLESNLSAVLRRRLIDAKRGVGDGLPLWSSRGVRFEDILAVWHGEVDEQRLSDLIHALSLVDPGPADEMAIRRNQADQSTPDLHTGSVWFDPDGQPHVDRSPLYLGSLAIDHKDLRAAFELPRVYHLLKLCFVGGRLPPRPVTGLTVTRSGDEPFPPDCPELLALIEGGRLSDATLIAARRLRAKGYPCALRDADLQGLKMDATQCRRLAGLLLIPVQHPGVLAALAIKPQTNI